MEWHLGWFGLNLPAEVSRDIDSGQPNLVFDRRQKRFNRGRQAGFPRLFLQFHAVMTLGCTSRFGFDRTYGTSTKTILTRGCNEIHSKVRNPYL